MIVLIGLIASVFVVMLSFTIQRKNIIIISSLLATTTATQYFLLDKYSTMLLAVITLLYGLLTLFERRFPVLKSNYALVILSLAYSAVFFFVNGFHMNMELVAYAASLSGVLVMALNNQLFAKWLMFVNGVAWTVYQLSSGAYGQLPGEIFYTIGVIFSLVVLHKAYRSGRDLNTVPELSTILLSKMMKKKKSNMASENVMMNKEPCSVNV